MTFEKIMEVFKEQFEIDKDIEVARFRRGYQIFIWDNKKQAYIPNAELIQSEEKLIDELLDETRRFYELRYRNSVTDEMDDNCNIKIENIINELKYKCDNLI